MQERLSVSLNERSTAILEKFMTKYSTSNADIVRRGLNCMDIMENVTEKANLEDILAYVDYMADGDHVIIDLAAWKLLCRVVEEGPQNFYDKIYTLGDNHRQAYINKGFKDIKQILRFMEKKNWFNVKEDSKNHYTLILTIAETSRFIKTFLEGCFSEYHQKVEIAEEEMKLRIDVL